MPRETILKKAKGKTILVAKRSINALCNTIDLSAGINSIHITCSGARLITDQSSKSLRANMLATFETHQYWQGDDFGFDALDQKKLNVGRYYESDRKTLVFEREHDERQIFLANGGLPNNQGDRRLLNLEYNAIKVYNIYSENPSLYYVPWLSLLPNKTASLILRIKMSSPANYIEFDTNEHFEISPKRFDGSKSGEYPITVKCIKEFKTDQSLVIQSYERISGQEKELGRPVGKLNVWANSTETTFAMDIVIVKVINQGIILPITEQEIKVLKNVLLHAHIIANIKMIEMDLTGTDVLESTFLREHQDEQKIVTPSDMSVEDIEKGIPVPEDPEGERLNIETTLETHCNNRHPEYKNYFKVFSLGYNHASKAIGGYYSVSFHVVMVFKARDPLTIAHEILHSLGLFHTFNNASFQRNPNIRFTYAFRQTNNIMDYTHGSETVHWQWEAVRRNQIARARASAPAANTSA